MSDSQQRPLPISKLIAPLLLFLITYGIYVSNNNNIQPADAIWTEHVAASLLYSGDIDLNEYLPFLEQHDFYAAVRSKDKVYSLFPLGTPLLVAPLLFASNIIITALGHEDLYTHLQTEGLNSQTTLNLHLFHASFFVALTTALIYIIARRKLPWAYAALLALTFAFATSAYSTASHVLWQHGPSMLMLALTIYFFVRAEAEARWVRFAGLPLTFAYVVRPTNSIAIVVFSIFVLLRYRDQLWGYLLGASLVAIPFVISNLVTFDTIFSPYYAPERIGHNPRFWEALIGNWFSPARGLLVFSPILIFSLLGVLLMLKKRTISSLDSCYIAIILLHALAISSFTHWWAGFSFGPRLFTDMMPLFILLMIPVLQWLADNENKLGWRMLLGTSFLACLLLTVFIHHRGATKRATWMWNSVPTLIDEDMARLWDWSDVQFLRGLYPAQSFIRPTQVSRPPPSAGESEAIVTLTLSNPGEHPVRWEIQLPQRLELINPDKMFKQTFDAYGLPLFVQNQPTPPFGKQKIEVRLLYSGYKTDQQSLGGIRLRAIDEKTAQKGRIQIVPVALTRNTTNVDSVAASFLAADILVDEALSTKGLYAIHGAGWYDLESTTEAQWRWAASPAKLYVHSNKKRDVVLTLNFAVEPRKTEAGKEGHLQFIVNGNQLPDQMGTVDEPLQVDVSLLAGWNELVLQSSSGNFRPLDDDPQSGDGRYLSYAVESIQLTTSKQ